MVVQNVKEMTTCIPKLRNTVDKSWNNKNKTTLNGQKNIFKIIRINTIECSLSLHYNTLKVISGVTRLE